MKMNYENYFSPEEQIKLRNHNLDKPILECVGQYDKILDVGAGAGILADKIKDMEKDITCVDIKSDYVKFMKKKGLKAIKASVTKLPFKDNEFDLVICEEVLEHLENPGEGLKELNRVGKNVIFTLPRLHPDKWHLWDIDWVEHAGCIVIKMMKRNGKRRI